MSDAPREPPDPELIANPAGGPRPGGTGIPVHRDVQSGREYIDLGPARRPPRAKSRGKLAVALFLLTILTTFYAGYQYLEPKPNIVDPRTGRPVAFVIHLPSLLNGLLYSAGVMTILGFHEMGHYLQARRYGVPATLPFFIPMPIGPLGTMGAVIVQRAGVADRKSMFDIAISGPLAGLVVALPLAWWGIQHSRIETFPPGMPRFGDPLILRWMCQLALGPLGPNQDYLLNPILFAGWVGILITAVNLMPIGQLDGGHILYCLIGKKSNAVARALLYTAIAIVAGSSLLGDHSYAGWTLMLALIWLMRPEHPPTANDNVPLGGVRVALGWLTLAFVIIGFTPTPFVMGENDPQPDSPRHQRQIDRDVVDARHE